ncbi:Lon protease family protein [Salisediminibacterium beveridgei]|uniref:endopeptidase La n=1 Tax=Salisediminibacterium beveridgei TaxID=632773 RepID=A0A1D7QV89_9BACI|nr:ATP-binding protein [Salisediminibacterium beveridgei]AOM82922.1 Putative Lon protease [Salisediminibacterium beveridgei]
MNWISEYRTSRKLTADQLTASCDLSQFPEVTNDSDEVHEKEMIGQERAEKAMAFGLGVKQSGYNLFVVGPSGTGRVTYTLQTVHRLAKERPVPNDWCYVYNFEDPDQPFMITFPPGNGLGFKKDMEVLLLDIEREIRSAFTTEEFEQEKRKRIESFKSEVDKAWRSIDQFASDKQIYVERSPEGIHTYPMKNGKPLTNDAFLELPEDERQRLLEADQEVEDQIQETVSEIRKTEEELRKAMHTFMQSIVSYAIEGLFRPLREKYQDRQRVLQYLDAYFDDVVEHFSLFFPEHDQQEQLVTQLGGPKEKQFLRFTVNLFVNHKERSGAPVIYETNPTFDNLFGRIEYQGQIGNMTTDFTKIKPGALHQTNGGYLILQANELFSNPHAWGALKRALQARKVRFEHPNENRGMLPTTGMKPQAMPLDVKIIIIGSYMIYDILSTIDEDFVKLFSVKVEFDTVMERDADNTMKLFSFIRQYAIEERLQPFHREAVAKVIDYSSRMVNEQNKLTTRFQDITGILVEANYYAVQAGDDIVGKSHIHTALEEKELRVSHIPERYREMIKSGRIMIDSDGYRIGQINGLAVLGSRDSVFGIPAKITAQTFAGKQGIINIEREASLSGQFHEKGMLILTGFLSGQFARNRPIPLSASITFEQSYSLIDGDSASSTELYVLLSSLSGCPINQGIAVTGSVNQWGEIQPIGGVNEKIEGFFHICRERGLTGSQGVIIPMQNIGQLMLHDDVINAVSKGDFSIWAIEHIAEGLEILMGIPSGFTPGVEAESYPDGSVFQKAQKRFDDMYEAMNEEKD